MEFLPGTTVDIAEISFAVLLVVGFRIRETAFLSGVMLFLFAFGMNLGVGVISTLDHSVYTASAASFLLAIHRESSLSLDAFISKQRPIGQTPPSSRRGKAGCSQSRY